MICRPVSLTVPDSIAIEAGDATERKYISKRHVRSQRVLTLDMCIGYTAIVICELVWVERHVTH